MSLSKPAKLHQNLHLTDLQNASLSAVAVVVALLAGIDRVSPMGLGLLVVGTQSVAGMNVQGSLVKRLFGAGQTGLILIGAGALALLVKSFLLTSLLGVIVLAFSFGFIRQRFPNNWPDINIPAAVIFFMAYNHTIETEVISLPAIGTVLGIGLQLVASFIFPASTSKNSSIVRTSGFKLRPDLQSYCIQLSLLLVAGWLAYRFTGYTFGYWMPFTSLVVLQAHPTQTRKKMLDRIVGTLAGCLMGSLILQVQPGFMVQLPILAACMFCFIYFVKTHYAVAAAFITTFVLILIGSQASEPLRVVLERMSFTCAGGLLAYFCSFLFLKRDQTA